MPNASIRLLLSALVVSASSLTAQAPPSKCTVDSSAKWFAKQREWMADDAQHKWANDSLRMALIHASGLDANPNAGTGALLGYEVMGSTPQSPSPDGAVAIAALTKIASSRGVWPGKSVVGAKGVLGVWLLASQDSAFARVALHRLMEAGPEESPAAAVAILEDRLRIASGRKQIYATQLVRGADGKLAPAPLEDPNHVDLRRDGAGLPPLAQAICAASWAR